MVQLKFLPNEGDIDQGLGDAGIETFRDTPYASVARECAQNSADARSINPVTVSFDLVEIDAEDLPSIDSYRSAVQSCLAKARTANIEKEIEFFENALQSISRNKLRVLRVSDTNTKGLVGPSTSGTPFHSLLKGTGVSVKDDPTSGGSFGIGKNAAFAISDIQTVFYSTLYNETETGNEKFLCQGKTVLVSHKDSNGYSNQATGYWGMDTYQPVSSQELVPDWLRRTEVGTSVFSVACREAQNWENGLAASLLQNFFGALYRNEMQFSINGTLNINNDTMPDLFASPQIRQAASENGQDEDFDFSKYLYFSLIALETKEEIIDIPGLGRVSVRILVSEGLPKRICFMRNGMFITDNLENFGERFRRFPLYKDFVALVEPIDKQGQTLLKKLENPKHNGFSAERLANAKKRAEAASAMKKLGKKIREVIRSQSLEKPEDSVTIDELAEFFAGDIDPDKLTDPDSIESNPEIYRYKPASPKRHQATPLPGAEDGEVGGGRGSNRGEGGESGGEGEGSGGGHGGVGGSQGGKTVRLSNIRNLIPDSNKKKRNIMLTPAETAKVELSVFAEGINSADRLEITASGAGKISFGKVILDFEQNKRLQFVVDFPFEYDGPIEIFAKTIGAGGDK